MGTFSDNLKSLIRWIVSLFRIQSRLGDLEAKVATIGNKEEVSPYRKCPQCQARDMRLQDRYRFKYHPYDRQRYFHEKWRCFSCGHLEQSETPEPGG